MRAGVTHRAHNAVIPCTVSHADAYIEYGAQLSRRDTGNLRGFYTWVREALSVSPAFALAARAFCTTLTTSEGLRTAMPIPPITIGMSRLIRPRLRLRNAVLL